MDSLPPELPGKPCLLYAHFKTDTTPRAHVPLRRVPGKPQLSCRNSCYVREALEASFWILSSHAWHRVSTIDKAHLLEHWLDSQNTLCCVVICAVLDLVTPSITFLPRSPESAFRKNFINTSGDTWRPLLAMSRNNSTHDSVHQVYLFSYIYSSKQAKTILQPINPTSISNDKYCVLPEGLDHSFFFYLPNTQLNAWPIVCVYVCVLSCVQLCDLTNCSPPGSSVHGDSPGKNAGVGCHALLQGIYSSVLSKYTEWIFILPSSKPQVTKSKQALLSPLRQWRKLRPRKARDPNSEHSLGAGLGFLSLSLH